MASHKLHPPPVVTQLPRHGTLCLYGFGLKVRVVNGHLYCSDGIGTDRRTFRLSKVNSNLKRVVLVGSDGFIALEAIRWVADRDASFQMLDRRGKALVVCGPSAPSDPRLRRSQSLALTNGTAVRISRDLIRMKLEGQATLVRDMLRNQATADAIQRLRAEVTSADNLHSIRLLESQAAKLYWQTWSALSIRWTRNDENKVGEHWKRFGARVSPLTGSPRLAVNPPGALLNFLYQLTENEARLLATAQGLDGEIGMLHVDTPYRSSLANDLQEPIRPSVDAFVFNWLQTEVLRKADFHENRNGECRISTPLAIELCETADTWRKLLAPVVEHVSQQLWRSSSIKGERLLLATRLTQRTKREVKGSGVPQVKHPRPEHVCEACGKKIRKGRTHCGTCAITSASERMVSFAEIGRTLAHTPEARAKEGEKQHKDAVARSSWDVSSQAVWLTNEFYSSKIKPLLAPLSNSVIASAIGVSRWYAGRIRRGYQPHPRHWHALAQLVSDVRRSWGRRKKPSP
jgi:CRISPR-associated endonuclease Cas1